MSENRASSGRSSRISRAASRISRAGTTTPYFGREGSLSRSDSRVQESPVKLTEEEELSKQKVIDYDLACSEIGIIPSSFIERTLWANTTEIRMTSHGLGPKGTKALAIVLVNNTHVKKLDLTDNNIGGDGAQALSQMLVINGSITELDLTSNNIDEAGIHSLCTSCEDKREIQKLTLSGNALNKKAVEHIQYFIDNNIHVKELNLSNCSIDSDGACKLASSIASNDTLLSLDLSWNKIRGRGVIAIAKCTKDNRGLVRLDVSWNGFAFEGCQALEESLKKNKTLVDLDLSANRIHAEGAACIFRAIQKNTVLEILKLNKNPLTAQAATLLIKAIGKMKHEVFKELHIEGVEVNDDFMDELATIRSHRNIVVRTGPVLSRRGRRAANMDSSNKIDASEFIRTLLEGQGVNAMDAMLQKEFKAKSDEINRRMLETRKRQDDLLSEELALKEAMESTEDTTDAQHTLDNTTPTKDDTTPTKDDNKEIPDKTIIDDEQKNQTQVNKDDDVMLTEELQMNPMYQVLA